MSTSRTLALLVTLGVLTAGCATPYHSDERLAYGALGGAAGAALGSAIGGGEAAIVGGVIGAAAGVAIADHEGRGRYDYSDDRDVSYGGGGRHYDRGHASHRWRYADDRQPYYARDRRSSWYD